MDLLSIQASQSRFPQADETAVTIKADIPRTTRRSRPTIVQIFETSRLQDRVTFEVALCQFGGRVIHARKRYFAGSANLSPTVP